MRQIASWFLVVLGVFLLGGSILLYLELGQAATAGGAVDVSTPLGFVVERVAAPIVEWRSGGSGSISPAMLVGTTEYVLWAGMALGFILGLIGLQVLLSGRQSVAGDGE